jgi:transposase
MIPSLREFAFGWRHTDMLRAMNSLALQIQKVLKRDPRAGDLYSFEPVEVT